MMPESRAEPTGAILARQAGAENPSAAFLRLLRVALPGGLVKGLLVACALVSVLILLFGCASAPKQDGNWNGQGVPSGNSSYEPIQSPPPPPPLNQSQNVTPQPPPPPPPNPVNGMAGSWKGTATELLKGPAEWIPNGCTVEHAITLDIVQEGDAISGTTTSTLEKITDCSGAVPDSWIGTRTMGPINGTVSGSSAVFSTQNETTISAVDFTATFADGSMSGNLLSCHSPDVRCTCSAPDKRCPGGVDAKGSPVVGMLETDSWWAGNFTLARVE